MTHSRARHGRIPVVLEEAAAAGCLFLLTVITLANVLVRYLTDESIAWTEEISVFLMVLMTLAGAAAAAARDQHIRIEYFYDAGSPQRRRALRVFGAVVTALVFAVLAALFARVVADEIKWQETTMGLGVPRWWYTLWVPMLCAVIALRALSVAWMQARELEAAALPPDSAGPP
jgi:TRAP-type C4-dicarboxylate transport system permease small subunit